MAVTAVTGFDSIVLSDPNSLNLTINDGTKLLNVSSNTGVINVDLRKFNYPQAVSLGSGNQSIQFNDANGNIIRAEIAEHIFTSTEEHKFCNSVIHPLVMDEIRRLTISIDAVAEIPLLPEAVQGRKPEWISRAVYVMAEFDVRAERCRISRRWSRDELTRRETFLLPESERLSFCDYVIRNNGSLSDLQRQAVKFLQENYT